MSDDSAAPNKPSATVPASNESYDGPVDVSVVLPCYNEEKAIPKVIGDIRAAMEGTRWKFEILAVDDKSKDRTVERLEKCGVRIVKHPVNRGSGASRRTGTIEARGEIIVMLDADGTYNAPDIPKMLEFFPDYDQVNGARTSEQGTHKLLRVPAKWAIRKLACYLAGRHIPDLNTGLKAFKRDVMMKYLWVLPNGFSCVTTMTLAFLCNGHPVKYVSSEYHKRIGKSKFHPVKDTANYFSTVIRMVTYFAPLRVFLPAAAFLLIAGIVKGLFNIIGPKHTLEESDIILICVGVLVLAVGMLADLIVAQKRG
ncbi:MAG: glycosyltransferase family 2 protein [Sumerlaeia bacterium]